MPKKSVILNKVKNLKSECLCIQILRVAQDDTYDRIPLWNFFT